MKIKKVRLCFYNPHAIGNTLGKTLISELAQIFGADKSNLKKHLRRHDFLLNFLRNDKYKTAIVVDGTDTSLSTILDKIAFFKNNYLIHRLISLGEIYIWCSLNSLNPLKQKIIFYRNKLDELPCGALKTNFLSLIMS
jgi:hypothetical protein